MDNNNPQGEQPQGPQGNMQGNPPQNPYPNQPYQNPPVMQQQPMMQQPMAPMQPMQPMAQPPKQPMDPAKKKKLILGLTIGGVALALGVAALIIVPMLLKVDYAPAYAAAKELEPKIYDIYYSYDCGYVVDDVDSSYTAPKTYNEYVEKCKAAYGSSVNDSIAELENTAGVKRNSEIGAQFSKFKAEYDALDTGDADSLAAKLALWQARHNFIYAADDLSYTSSSDAEFTTAANYLINSGNDALKTYGEGWLEKSLAVAAAYRAYHSASLRESSSLYTEYTNKKKEKDDWTAANKPDIAAIAPLNFSDTSKVYSEFTKLYELIATTYQENYNYGSGDCSEILNEVYCD